jgi:hypothetical protein
MTGDANEVRDLMPSLNRGGSPATCVAVSAWLSNTRSACLGHEASTDEDGFNPDNYSIASNDQLLMTAESGHQQVFVELCRRHSPMAKKEFSRLLEAMKMQKTCVRIRQQSANAQWRSISFIDSWLRARHCATEP